MPQFTVHLSAPATIGVRIEATTVAEAEAIAARDHSGPATGGTIDFGAWTVAAGQTTPADQPRTPTPDTWVPDHIRAKRHHQWTRTKPLLVAPDSTQRDTETTQQGSDLGPDWVYDEASGWLYGPDLTNPRLRRPYLSGIDPDQGRAVLDMLNALPSPAATPIAHEPMTAERRERAVAALGWHLTDSDEESGCALRCGYHGDDRAEHLADAVLAVLTQEQPDAADEAGAPVLADSPQTPETPGFRGPATEEREWRCGRCHALPHEHVMPWRQAYECDFDPAFVPVPAQYPTCSWSRLDTEDRATLCAMETSAQPCACRAAAADAHPQDPPSTPEHP